MHPRTDTPAPGLHLASLVPQLAEPVEGTEETTAMEVEDDSSNGVSKEKEGWTKVTNAKKRRLSEAMDREPTVEHPAGATKHFVIHIGSEEPSEAELTGVPTTLPHFKRITQTDALDPADSPPQSTAAVLFKTGTAPTLRESAIPITAAFLANNVRKNDRAYHNRVPIQPPRHTPVPNCGFYPPQHGRHTFWLLDGIVSHDAATFLKWEDPKAFLLVWNHTAGDGKEMQTAHAVEHELTTILGHERARVSPPPY